LTDFYTHGWNRAHTKIVPGNTCKTCIGLRNKKERQTEAGRAREWRHHLKRKFRITPKDAQTLLWLQDGTCASCGAALRRFGKKGDEAVIDHDHGIDKVRSVLCGNCNKALGFLKEDYAKCVALAAYIKLYCQGKEQA
jgi:Recombination endonuclease VII